MIVIVGGIPRSGTSLLMQMLESGGMEILTDGKREKDESNQRGYYEYEPALKICEDDSWMLNAEGRAVKILTHLIKCIPRGYDYKVFFCTRNLDETIDSQDRMMGRETTNREKLKESLEKYRDEIWIWLREQENVELFEYDYNMLMRNKKNYVRAINIFLGEILDEKKMLGVIDEDLYRQRRDDS